MNGIWQNVTAITNITPPITKFDYYNRLLFQATTEVVKHHSGMLRWKQLMKIREVVMWLPLLTEPGKSGAIYQ